MTEEAQTQDVKLPEPAVYRASWDRGIGWHQYHDQWDPMPTKWDDEPPDEVEGFFTADQVRAAVMAERERCARICDEKAAGIERVNTYRGKVNAVSQHAADMVADAAAAIRSGS